MHVWALGLWCETPAASGPRGLHTTTRELQTCTFVGPGASKHHPKTTRRPEEREKERNWWWETEEKARNFGPSTLRGATLWGPKPSGPNPSGPDVFWVWAAHHDTHQIQGLAKNGLAKTGLAKVGPFPRRTCCVPHRKWHRRFHVRPWTPASNRRTNVPSTPRSVQGFYFNEGRRRCENWSGMTKQRQESPPGGQHLI